MQFDELRLNESLLRAVRAAGYETPTPIQAKAIPVVLDGRDVLGCAQTGTGKTAAFALPVLHQLSKSSATPKRPVESDGEHSTQANTRSQNNRAARRAHLSAPSKTIRAAVLCPTRELAQQIHESFVTYGKHTSIRATPIFGGVNQNSQVRALRAGVDVVIATPGRLLDLMNQGFVNLSNIEVLVLDEADHMLDMGFLPDIRRILGQMPKQRQSLLFSATMPPPIRALANDMLSNPVPIQVAPVATPAERVTHEVYHVDQSQKTSLLVHLLEDTAAFRALVFTRTKRGADTLTRKLMRAGVPAAAIHGNKSQAARNRALAEFRSAKTPVLVATDLAARGIDIDDIGHVFNYDLTPDPETYVHRIGRTGRAGATGSAISFCTRADRPNLRAIEKLIRTPLQNAQVPGWIEAAHPQSSRDDAEDARPSRSDSTRRRGQPPKRKSGTRAAARSGGRSNSGERTTHRSTSNAAPSGKRNAKSGSTAPSKPGKRPTRRGNSEGNTQANPKPIRRRRSRRTAGSTKRTAVA